MLIWLISSHTTLTRNAAIGIRRQELHLQRSARVIQHHPDWHQDGSVPPPTYTVYSQAKSYQTHFINFIKHLNNRRFGMITAYFDVNRRA
jgi:hypothetical protein